MDLCIGDCFGVGVHWFAAAAGTGYSEYLSTVFSFVLGSLGNFSVFSPLFKGLCVYTCFTCLFYAVFMWFDRMQLSSKKLVKIFFREHPRLLHISPEQSLLSLLY